MYYLKKKHKNESLLLSTIKDRSINYLGQIYLFIIVRPLMVDIFQLVFANKKLRWRTCPGQGNLPSMLINHYPVSLIMKLF